MANLGYNGIMRIVVKNGIEMAELNAEEHASLDARIRSLNRGKCRTYTEDEIDEIWRLQDIEQEQHKKERAA